MLDAEAPWRYAPADIKFAGPWRPPGKVGSSDGGRCWMPSLYRHCSGNDRGQAVLGRRATQRVAFPISESEGNSWRRAPHAAVQESLSGLLARTTLNTPYYTLGLSLCVHESLAAPLGCLGNLLSQLPVPTEHVAVRA